MKFQEVVDSEWGWTPDVILFIAAALLSVIVIAFGSWLFFHAASEEKRKARDARESPKDSHQ